MQKLNGRKKLERITLRLRGTRHLGQWTEDVDPRLILTKKKRTFNCVPYLKVHSFGITKMMKPEF